MWTTDTVFFTLLLEEVKYVIYYLFRHLIMENCKKNPEPTLRANRIMQEDTIGKNDYRVKTQPKGEHFAKKYSKLKGHQTKRI